MAIQQWWACGRAGHLAHCFVKEDKEHVGLSHEMQDVWAMAMVRAINILWNILSVDRLSAQGR